MYSNHRDFHFPPTAAASAAPQNTAQLSMQRTVLWFPIHIFYQIPMKNSDILPQQPSTIAAIAPVAWFPSINYKIGRNIYFPQKRARKSKTVKLNKVSSINNVVNNRIGRRLRWDRRQKKGKAAVKEKLSIQVRDMLNIKRERKRVNK